MVKTEQLFLYNFPDVISEADVKRVILGKAKLKVPLVIRTVGKKRICIVDFTRGAAATEQVIRKWHGKSYPGTRTVVAADFYWTWPDGRAMERRFKPATLLWNFRIEFFRPPGENEAPEYRGRFLDRYLNAEGAHDLVDDDWDDGLSESDDGFPEGFRVPRLISEPESEDEEDW
ncbi:unnamed protein product, partial [Mesorhabditis spiculigera]